MGRRTPKSIKASCDKLFSQLVRSRKSCEKCGDKRYEQLHTAHIHSRKYGSIRFEELNALSLCARCHRWAHDNPTEFTKWIDKSYPGRTDLLTNLKNVIVKRKISDWKELEDTLKAKLKGVHEISTGQNIDW